MVEGALGAASSGLQQQEYEGFTGAPQRTTNQIVDPNSREATLSRKNNLVLSGLVLATITGKEDKIRRKFWRIQRRMLGAW